MYRGIALSPSLLTQLLDRTHHARQRVTCKRGEIIRCLGIIHTLLLGHLLVCKVNKGGLGREIGSD